METINLSNLAKRAEALLAVKYEPPLAEDSSYSTAYTQGLAALVGELFAQLGDTADEVGDTLRAAGVVGHSWEGRMVGEPGPDRLNPVSAWLRSLLGPGHYEYSGGGYWIDLDVPDGDTEDADSIPVPPAVATFLAAIEDPTDDEIHRYRGLIID